MKHVSSRDNPLFRQVKALAHSSRERRKAGVVLLEGAHLVAAALDAQYAPQSLVVSETAQQDAEVTALMARTAAAHGLSVTVFSDVLFNEISNVETPSGIMALIAPRPPQPVAPGTGACLLLEDIQDPGNVGSMLRTAAAAGVQDVLLSPTCAYVWAPKVLRAGQGAHFVLNIVEGADLAAFARAYPGQAVALAPRARRAIYDVDLQQPTVFMIGNEGAGLTTELTALARIEAGIPMPGGIESLNAAAATAICLFELVRQRRTNEKTS